jgi:3-methylcrotonyl-CoA carboxylase beta subunit
LESLNTHTGKISGITERTHKYTRLIKDYYTLLKEIQYPGLEKQKTYKQNGGKLSVRERINLLIDRNTPFLELSPMAAINQYDNKFPAAGIVTGIGIVEGKYVVVIANDSAVKGGTYVAETIKKHIRAQEIAFENNLPCVYLVDSGGIFLPDQARVFPDKEDFGRIFYNQARLSAEGIPQISLVLGSCTAGGAYVPAMSDEVIIVKNQGTIFLGGPPLVKAATGEEVAAEELGGAAVHTGKSGVADHLAEDEYHAFSICRNIFKYIHSHTGTQIEGFENPRYDIKDIYDMLPFSSRENFDPRELIERIVDASDFLEFKSNYGKTLVTGFAKIFGMDVGIIANHGILYSESALKGTHFIELCNYRKIPILFLQNITGFMVGKHYENAGIAKDGAKMVSAVATSVVPKITLIIGGSYGAGNYAMAGRAYNPRFLFMYPSSRISVMGAEQAADVLQTIKADQLKKNEKKMSTKEIGELRSPIVKKYNEESSAYYSTSRLWDDGIIDPADTRKVIGLCLDISKSKKQGLPKPGIYRM